MVRIQKRISRGFDVFQYYTTKEWYFRNTNFQSLRNRINENDNNVFYTDLKNFDIDEYMEHYALGARQYCCKEDLSTLPRARRLYKM